MQLICVTGNEQKFAVASATCAEYGVTLEQVAIDIDEVQGEDYRYIAEQKARVAYSHVGEPVVVTDDAWEIHGLNGFPGAYMKSINHWLTVEDFLRLTCGLTDKSVTLRQQIAYCDKNSVQVFENSVSGVLLETPRGETGPPFTKIASLDGDDGMSIAEKYDIRLKNTKSSDHKRQAANVWHSFAKWYSTQ